MATLAWIGGGNNNASNPADWSPTGVPQSFDTLEIVGPFPATIPPVLTLPTYTMNVSKTDLAGDTLMIQFADVTVNMWHDAIVTAQTALANATFNLSQNSTLSLEISYNHLFSGSTATVDVLGSDTLNLEATDPAVVNLAKNSIWIGSFNVFGGGYDGRLTASGGRHSAFMNSSSSVEDFASAVVAVPIVGTGTFLLGGGGATLEFASSVGADQSISVAGNGGDNDILRIDHPGRFHGSITLLDSFGSEEIDLIGLAHADSYTFRNDILTIFPGSSIIDTLRLYQPP